ncbi:hypothetical protein PO909_028134, partial [Leuciscus waleckii]
TSRTPATIPATAAGDRPESGITNNIHTEILDTGDADAVATATATTDAEAAAAAESVVLVSVMVRDPV